MKKPNRIRFSSAHTRRNRAASLVLVVGIFGGLTLGILLFCLGYTGLIGSYHEQRSAVEAAALAAVKDLSAIVIDDPNFGLIGLSDSGPIGTDTVAGDGFFTSVTGLNTLFGTIRLDLIIADYLQDPVMTRLALTDYNNALIAQRNLLAALTAAAAPGGTGKDANGTTLNPTQDAIDAYNANSVHLAIGQTSSLVPGSLKLTLGYVEGLATRTAIPRPESIANVSSSQQLLGFYVPNVEIKYKDTPFVFAALSANSTLVDFRAFKSTLDDLLYSTPTVVKVDADEEYLQNGINIQTIHAAAAAVAGTIVDQRPNPGAFTITFVHGPVPEITTAGDLLNHSQLRRDPTDQLLTAANGDYPQNPVTNYSLPMLAHPEHPKFENVLSVALYDWIRRGGTNVNVKSLIDTLEAPINYGAGGPQMQRYHITASGAITNDSIPWGQTNLCVSDKQFRALSGLGIGSANGKKYDLQITDYVHVPGRTKGGIHAGEPLNNPGLTGNNPNSGSYTGSTIFENATWPYQEFLTGSNTVRPTYNSDGIAIDFTLRKR